VSLSPALSRVRQSSNTDEIRVLARFCQLSPTPCRAPGWRQHAVCVSVGPLPPSPRMPLFDAPVPRRLLWPIDAPWPHRRAQRLLTQFQACFPQVTYDMDLGVELANAQAFLEGEQKRVRLFGGLVRHRKIGAAGLALALAHETGHHLGGPPFLPYYRWLSSEERATDWAMTVGLQKVFGKPDALRIGRQGVDQLEGIRPRD
jgi:hypothetical protein